MTVGTGESVTVVDVFFHFRYRRPKLIRKELVTLQTAILLGSLPGTDQEPEKKQQKKPDFSFSHISRLSKPNGRPLTTCPISRASHRRG